MESYRLERSPDGRPLVRVPYRTQHLLNHPMYNKGSAFTRAERQAFALEGLLPLRVSTLQHQRQRIYSNIIRKKDPLERYVGLAALQDRNEHLFYRLMVDHIDEFLPIMYTPTVGQACQEFSHMFRRPRGLWITTEHRGRIYDVLGNAPYDDVRLIVVTDAERILGLGDQGAGGMGIPVGKLVIYTVAAGVHPSLCLPICIDVGTDNTALRDDPLYLGAPQPRLRGPEYESLIDEFVQAVKKRWPKCLLQWEDFKKQNAFDLLDRYRQALPSFNDDIQGTAAISQAAILAAGRATQTPLTQQRVVMLGAGAAGIGIARLLRDSQRRAGLAGADLMRGIAVLDSKGLLVEGREVKEASKRDFAWPVELVKQLGLPTDRPANLMEVIQALKPTALVGTTGEPGAFSEAIIKAMAQATPRPAIFPLSNPTTKCEALPKDIVAWTQGRAIIATGSPFEPVPYEGRSILIGQANNAYVFPGIGLGILVSGVKVVSDNLFTAAAESLAAQVGAEDLAQGALFPPMKRIRQVTANIAAAVVRQSIHEGAADEDLDEGDVEARVQAAMWDPQYPVMVPADEPHWQSEELEFVRRR
jgi:malic enzyme